MSERSAIEWTEATWNPVTGCSKVSPGCAHCYAETFAERFRGVPGHPLRAGLRPAVLARPARASAPVAAPARRVRQLHERPVPRGGARSTTSQRVFDVMARAELAHVPGADQAPRPARRARARADWPPNVWMGVSIENRRFVHRADRLREVARRRAVHQRRAAARPARRSRPRRASTGSSLAARAGLGTGPSTRSGCATSATAASREGVAFFFKQWGGRTPKTRRTRPRRADVGRAPAAPCRSRV